MIVLIDNYDSFTYNLYQYACMLGEKVSVYRNDEITPSQLKRKRTKAIIISPGPGNPNGAGACLSIVEQLSPLVPILGVCLGHQTIAQAYGGKIVRASQMMHGKVSEIFHSRRGLYKGFQNPMKVARYHSLTLKMGRNPRGGRVVETSNSRIL